MIEIVCSDALSFLKQMENETVDLVLTSPPYWGLRDYGINDSKALGLEKDPEEYVKKLVEIMKECIRVLKNTGSIYLNLGDTYYDKTLVGIPWWVAFELLSEGLYLRNVIIWYKPNALPSSVKDRFSNTYEYVFFFTKQKKYYFNLDAVRIPHKSLRALDKKVSLSPSEEQIRLAKKYRCRESHYQLTPTEGPNRDSDKLGLYEQRALTKHDIAVQRLHASYTDPLHTHEYHPLGKNPGDMVETELDSVEDFWQITTQPFKDAHFAVFPLELCWRPILASCPSDGLVLDPFAGSGTVGEAVAILNILNKMPTQKEVKAIRKALGLGVQPIEMKASRKAVLLDINPEYVELMKKRLSIYLRLGDRDCKSTEGFETVYPIGELR